MGRFRKDQPQRVPSARPLLDLANIIIGIVKVDVPEVYKVMRLCGKETVKSRFSQPALAYQVNRAQLVQVFFAVLHRMRDIV